MNPLFHPRHIALFAALIIAAAPSISHSQSETPPRYIPWRALVLFENGELNRIEPSGRMVPLHFRDALYEGDRIELAPGRGRLVKIQLRAGLEPARLGCRIAVYSDREQAVLSPPLEGEIWKIKGEALRAVSGPGESCEFAFRGANVRLEPNSEIFFDGLRVLALKGIVRLPSMPAPLPADSVYRFDSQQKAWVAASEKTPFEFQNSRKLMAESVRIPEPPSIPSMRIEIGPEFGGSSFTFDQSYLNRTDEPIDGGRGQVQFRWGDRSLIAMLHYRGSDGRTDRPPSGDSVKVRSDFFGGEIGIRLWHNRWWSPFFRIGFGREQPKIDVSYPSQGYYRSERIEFHSVSAGGGVDLLLEAPWFHWLALYGSAEIHCTQSLGRGARENLNNSTPNPSAAGAFTNEPWYASAVGLMLHLGLMFQL